jgi:hypothetical protein
MTLTRFFLASIAQIFLYQYAQAICLNPLGCEPQTQQECIKSVSTTRTEAGARAQLAECYKLPRVNLALCEKSESQWIDHMRRHNGMEWNWPDSNWSTKQDCKRQYPKMFSATKWVVKSYCVGNADQIRRNLDLTQLETGRSVKLDEARKNLYALAELDDRLFIDTMRHQYYPNMSNAEIARGVGIDAPADVINVAFACQQLSSGATIVEWIASEIAQRHNAKTANLQDPTVVRTQATAKGKEVIFRFVIKASPNANPNALQDHVLPATCQMNASNPAFKDGLFYTFEYTDVNRRQISRFSVGSSQCRG